jgi:hypothetical protein
MPDTLKKVAATSTEVNADTAHVRRQRRERERKIGLFGLVTVAFLIGAYFMARSGAFGTNSIFYADYVDPAVIDAAYLNPASPIIEEPLAPMEAALSARPFNHEGYLRQAVIHDIDSSFHADS